MTRTKFNLICVAILLAVIAFKYYEPAVSPNPNPDPPTPVATSADMLITYNVNNKPGKLVDSSTFRTWLEAHHVNWRISPSSAVFNDDEPVFQKLMAQERKGDNWLYLDNGRRFGKVSQPLPETEDAAEKLIGRYVK